MLPRTTNANNNNNDMTHHSQQFSLMLGQSHRYRWISTSDDSLMLHTVTETT